MKYIQVTRPKGWNADPGNNEGNISNFILFDSEGGSILLSILVMELAWRENKPDFSCIPLGKYPLKWMYSPHHQRNIYHVMGIQGRDLNGQPANVEVHSGNYAGDTTLNNPLTGRPYLSNLLGCMMVGDSKGMMNSQLAILNSKVTLDKFEELMNQEDAIIEVVEAA